MPNLLIIMLQRPYGIVSLMDEQCRFPKATDDTFVDALKQHLGAHDNLMINLVGAKKPQFTILHYAAKVECSVGCYS